MVVAETSMCRCDRVFFIPFGGDHGGGGGDGMVVFLAETTEAKVGTACFSFDEDHGGGGGDGNYFMAGTKAAEARTAFFLKCAWRRRWDGI